jgi:hypothetical protein
VDETKSVIITHGEDPDGIFSSVLLGKYLKTGFKRFFVSYGRLEEFFQKLSQSEEETKGKDLYFADISCNEDILPFLQQIAELANSVTWIDHHENTHRNRLTLREMEIRVITNPFDGVPQPICSALLIAQKIFMAREKCRKNVFWFSFFAQASDYRQNYEETCSLCVGILAAAKKLQAIINFHNWRQDDGALGKLADKLARGKEWYRNGELDDELESVFKEYAKEAEQAQKKLRQSARPFIAGGRKFCIYFASGLIYSKDTMRSLLEELPEDTAGIIVIFGSPADNALFFHRDPNFDPVPFCNYMGGGGREGIGGFSLKREVTAINFSEMASGVIEKLQAFYED